MAGLKRWYGSVRNRKRRLLDGAAQPFNSGAERTLWNVAGLTHQLSMVAVLTVALAICISRDQPLTPVLTLVCVSLALAFAQKWAQHQRYLPPELVIGDIAVLTLLVVSIPDLLSPVAMLLSSRLALVSLIIPKRSVRALVIVAICACAFVVLVVRPPDGLMRAGGYLFAVSLIVVPLSAVVRSFRRANTHHIEIFDSMAVILWEETQVDGALAVSRRAEDILGHDLAEWSTPGFWRSLLHPRDLEQADAVIARNVSNHRDHVVRFRMRHAEGHYVWFENRASSVRDAHGRHVMFRGVMVDQTAQMLSKTNEERAEQVIAASPIAHCIFSVEDPEADVIRVVLCNPAALEMLDGSETDLVGHYVSELRGRLPLYDFLVAAIKKVGLTGERLSGEFSSARGELAVAVQRLVDGSVAFSAEDISDRVRASRALEHSASHDSLSGLPNRAALLRHLDAALELAAPVALVMIDLDEFKDVNDALGHHMGDRLLQSVAERLNRRFPELLVARLGGDEFAILATEVDLDAARSIAEGVTHLFSEPFPLAEVMVTGSASVGVAAAPLHANSTAELMRRADVAMYAAKRQRTGWAEYDEGFDESSVRRLQLASRLRDAFDCSELELWFQPIVTVDDQRVVDLEALVRWRHPELGMVMPDEFIPLAEMSGAIRPLTRFVISETIRVGHELVARGTDVGVSCNLSARNLYEHDLVEWFDDLIAERGLPAGGFGMELTETALMEDSPAARAVLDAFVARGVTVAMDDFGTGYSSLAQLRALPIEVVKIDRSFVMGVAVRPDDRTIVRSVIELAHGLGRKVVAEGVDDAATLATLAELGCERAQGYYFARPLPERRLFEFLEAPSNVAPWNNAPWNAETPAEAGVSQESG